MDSLAITAHIISLSYSLNLYCEKIHPETSQTPLRWIIAKCKECAQCFETATRLEILDSFTAPYSVSLFKSFLIFSQLEAL